MRAGSVRLLTLLEETTRAVVALLAGETVVAHGRYVNLDSIRLEYPPHTAPPISLGVTGPRSLRLSGEIATGTVLSEGHGPPEIAAARGHIDAGGQRAEDQGTHHLTVFVACHVGSEATMTPRNPMAPVGWEAVGDTPADVADQLRELTGSGVDTVVLVPLGRDLGHDVRVLGEEVVPRLR